MSFSWAAFAAGSVVFGTIRDKKAMRLLGIGLIFLTLLKLVFIDLPIVSLLMRSIPVHRTWQHWHHHFTPVL
ncbi:hypothetical protein [Anoxybacteroides rupiense]|uniref:hypothetical protein n=1 Tax=Anoxybacteroides rupiense TaxID=311460 RepID=UPI001605AF22|nr:hypothetical protein [Anoxybacillus rupiensis]MBB3905780.1 putative membrane protein [Anoxybacillus rupiensis]